MNELAFAILILAIVGLVKIVACIFNLIKKIILSITREIRKAVWKNQKATPKVNQKDTIRKEIDWIILHTKVCIREPKYRYKPDYITFQAFLNNPYKQEYLEKVTEHVLMQGGYTGPHCTVQYSLLGNKPSKHIINECRAYIMLNSEPKRPPQVLFALLIHECMNICIKSRKIEYGNVNQEYAAEVMAVYMGFYQYIAEYSSYLSKANMQYIYSNIYNENTKKDNYSTYYNECWCEIEQSKGVAIHKDRNSIKPSSIILIVFFLMIIWGVSYAFFNNYM